MNVIRAALRAWRRHRAQRLAAALSFYAIFSLAPLLVIATGVAGIVYGDKAAAGLIMQQLQDIVGPNAALAVQTLIQDASKPSSSLVATIVGGIALVIAASGVFGAVKDAMDVIWERDHPSSGFLEAVRHNLLSLALVVGTGIMLLLLLVANTAVAAVDNIVLHGAAQSTLLLRIADAVVSFVLIAALFCAFYRFLPFRRLHWSDVALGGASTAAMFLAGQVAISYFLGRAAISTTYGATAALLVVFVWVYYSAQVFLFGAELTRAFAERHGS